MKLLLQGVVVILQLLHLKRKTLVHQKHLLVFINHLGGFSFEVLESLVLLILDLLLQECVLLVHELEFSLFVAKHILEALVFCDKHNNFVL